MRAGRSLLDRPLVLLVLGSVGLLFALVAAVLGVHSLTRLADIDDVPRCERDFAGECRTERETLVTGMAEFSRGRSWDNTPTWPLEVRGDQRLPDGQRSLYLQFRPQDHLDEVRPNIAVTVVFIGTDPAWLRLPSGAVVESEEHPQYAGLAFLCVALMTAGPSMTAVTTGVRVGRRGSWFRVAQDGYAPDVWWLLFGVGLLGFVVQSAFPRPPLFLVLCGIGIAGLFLCYLIWLVLPIPSKGRHAPGRRRRA